MSGSTSAAAPAKPTPQQINNYARGLIQAQCPLVKQPVVSQSIVPENYNNQWVYNLNNVGLTTDLFVDIDAVLDFSIGEGDSVVLTPWGVANILNSVLFIDNYSTQRVNTSARHLHHLASIKTGKPYCSAFSVTLINATDAEAYSYGVPGYGDNVGVISAPAVLASSGSYHLKTRLHIPFVRDLRRDLRGAMLTNVSQGTFQLTLNINPTPLSISGSAFKAVYVSTLGNSTGTFSGITFTLYQQYYDNLPRAQNGGQYILPNLDLSVYYCMTESVWPNVLIENSDNYITFNPNQSYYSRILMWDNGGTNLTTDVGYFEKLAANQTPIWKAYLDDVAARDEVLLQADPPLGTLFANYSNKPLLLQVAGNQSLVLNPANVNANSILYVQDESYIGLAQSGVIAVQ